MPVDLCRTSEMFNYWIGAGRIQVAFLRSVSQWWQVWVERAGPSLSAPGRVQRPLPDKEPSG